MSKHSTVPQVCPDCGASLPHTHPTAIERCATIKRQRKLEAWTHVQKLIRVGAYSERSAEQYENDSWPEDGVEETAFALEEWARKQALEFVWSWDTRAWSLEPAEMDVTPE